MTTSDRLGRPDDAIQSAASVGHKSNKFHGAIEAHQAQIQ